MILRSEYPGAPLEEEERRFRDRLKAAAAAMTARGGGSPSRLLDDLAPRFLVHGLRKGDEESGQLSLESPALAGLDLRVCSARRLGATFAEHQDSFWDGVDPSLNPDDKGNHSPGCATVVAKVNISVAKQKLGLELRS